jgi:nickel-dependent lactate racemase
MVKIDVPYGKDGHLDLELPERNFMGRLSPRDVPDQKDKDPIGASLDSPIGAERIERFLEGGKDVVFIVNDGTRPTPTAQVLDSLAQRSDLSRFRFLIATGAHRGPSEEELRFIFGHHLETIRHRIHSHDAREDRCVHLGRSKNGTDMEISQIAVGADRLVIITSVEPHYFAGYTGGRKSFLPGVASFKTIQQNHRLAMRPEAKVLALAGNPVHEDMIDALSVVRDKNIFSIQVVMDRHQKVYRSFSGDLFQAFDQAVQCANDIFVVDLEEKADMVITVAPYPMDIDLYQSQKAIDNAKFAVRSGGVILLVSKCRSGLGDETFCHQMAFSTDPHRIMENLNQEYKLGYHKAAKLAEIMTTNEIWAVTDLEDDVLRKINIFPFPDVQGAVDSLLAKDGNAKILVMMDGSVTVPRIG